MNISLNNSQLEELVRRQVATGRYKDAEEVVTVAIRQLDERERYQRLKAAIAEADAEIERGELVEYTPELVEQMKREGERMVREGIAPDPDVCP